MRNARRLAVATALVVLAAACSKDKTSTTPTNPSCTITAGTISASTFGAAGGTGTVPVTAGSGCNWTATSSATFVTITGGATGSGNGTVTFSIAANTGAARTATLTIAGTTFTVSQSAGAPVSTGSFSPPTPQSPVGGTTVTSNRPTLVVGNATATGTVGAVTYRFEVSDQSSFPNDPVRTFTVDGIAQGTGTTGWTLNRDLGPSVLWYWHARATDGTATSDYSATETFRTQSTCTYAISPTSLSINSTSATSTITVTAPSGCAWTATSNASFITIVSGASGSGNGSVFISIPDNGGPARTGTLTIAGLTFTVSQAGALATGSFELTDPSTSGSSATTECRIRSGGTPPPPTTCTLRSTSVPTGTTTIVNYAWTVQYVYDAPVTVSQSGANPQFSFTDTCGKTGSTSDGVARPLQVTLTITDSAGGTATVSSGTGSQPALSIRLFTCGS